MHLVRHFLARMRRSTFQNVGLVVIQPLKSMISIKRLNPRTHPAAKVAIAVGVDLDVWFSCQGDSAFAARTIQHGSVRHKIGATELSRSSALLPIGANQPPESRHQDEINHREQIPLVAV